MSGEVCCSFIATCTTEVTGLGATDTYDAGEILLPLAVYGSVAADGKRREIVWDDVVQRAGEPSG